jgi:hypothetical protein
MVGLGARTARTDRTPLGVCPVRPFCPARTNRTWPDIVRVVRFVRPPPMGCIYWCFAGRNQETEK